VLKQSLDQCCDTEQIVTVDATVGQKADDVASQVTYALSLLERDVAIGHSQPERGHYSDEDSVP